MEATPRDLGLHMPAEWERHDRTLMAWPARRALWRDDYEEACDIYAEVAQIVAGAEPVTVVADPADAGDAAARFGPDVDVDVVALPLDDSWMRDSGPIGLVGRDGRRAVADFEFNGWGGKYSPWGDDDALAGRVADLLGLPSHRAPFVLEGGSIAVDGQGTLITTEQCLLHPNRNPGLTRAEIERGLQAYLGVARVIWIPFGLADDDDTDGHVDNVACFVAPGVVLVQGCDEPDSPDYERLAVNRRRLESATDARGRPLEIVEIPALPHATGRRGRRPVPYVNFYVTNESLVVPVAGDPRDDKMLAVISSCFPQRAVVPVDGTVLAQGGGGVHCITQQVPAAPSS